MMSYPIALPECRKIIMLFHARQIGLLITLFIVAGFASSETLVLNNSTDPPLTSEHGTGFLDRLAQEAFRRAGLELKLVKLPAERALRNANSGIEDGDLNRIAGIENTYTNLVRVPEKSMDMEFTAFTRQTSTSTVD
jgi:polar amino acid transport system substrate-binding protein